jgi:hypothetical protein
MGRKEENFQKIFPIDDINKSLSIKLSDDKKSLHVDDDITLIIENRSPHFLFFDLSHDYIKLFMESDSEWVEVKNKIAYSGSRTLSPQGIPLLNLDGTWVEPVFEENMIKDKTDVLLRIVVIGKIIENDVPTEKAVGAYVDVHMSP